MSRQLFDMCFGEVVEQARMHSVRWRISIYTTSNLRSYVLHIAQQ